MTKTKGNSMRHAFAIAFALIAMCAASVADAQDLHAETDENAVAREQRTNAAGTQARNADADNLDGGIILGQMNDEPEEPPNQNSPDDGPRRPKSGCSSGGTGNDSQWIVMVACIVAYACRLRRSGRAR